MNLTVEIKENGKTTFRTNDKGIKKIIKDSLKRFKKENFNEYESEVALASLIPFIMVPQSIGVNNLVVDYYQSGVSEKNLGKEMKEIVKRYISYTSKKRI